MNENARPENDALPRDGKDDYQGLPEPYYSDDSVTIYHGDNAEVLPMLTGVDLVLTSPPYNFVSRRAALDLYADHEEEDHGVTD